MVIRIPLAVRPYAARAPWPAAVVGAAAIAGTASLLLMIAIGTLAYDESPWKLPRMMAALLRGPAALAPEDEFDAGLVALGFGMHYMLSLVYTLALAGLLHELPRESAPLAGLLFGLLLYAANLHGFTQWFPWFAPMRTPDTLVAHAVFGFLAAAAYWHLATSSPEDDPTS
jgi:hypothetical protein